MRIWFRHLWKKTSQWSIWCYSSTVIKMQNAKIIAYFFDVYISFVSLECKWKVIGEALDKKPGTCRKFYQTYKCLKDLTPKTKISTSRSKITASIGLRIKQQVRDNHRVSERKLVTIINGDINHIYILSTKRPNSQIYDHHKTLKARPILTSSGLLMYWTVERILNRFKFGQYIQEQLNIIMIMNFWTKFFGLMKQWYRAIHIRERCQDGRPWLRVHHSVNDENWPLNQEWI